MKRRVTRTCMNTLFASGTSRCIAYFPQDETLMRSILCLALPWRHEPVDSLARDRKGHVVDLSLFVFPERHDRHAARGNRLVGDDPFLGLGITQRPNLARDVVAVDIGPVQFRQARAAIDQAARDRFADVVMILPDRLNQVRARPSALAAEGVHALAPVPAIVASCRE